MPRAKPYRPGPGWDDPHPTAPVYEHVSGARVHVMGLLRLTDGTLISGMEWPESKVLWRYVEANGGNRKRGAMAWAAAKIRECNE